MVCFYDSSGPVYSLAESGDRLRVDEVVEDSSRLSPNSFRDPLGDHSSLKTRCLELAQVIICESD